VFSQPRKLRDFPVHHILQTVGQVITVASVKGHTLHTFSMELAGSRTIAVIQARLFDLGQELVLQLTRAGRFALSEKFHRPDFQGMVVDGHDEFFRVCMGSEFCGTI
jgi:hypothetical protein